MLVQFTLENFRSFKEKTTLSLVSADNKDKGETYLCRNDMRLLPLAGIFGPNASGKSNIIKAFAYVYSSILNTNPLNFPSTANPVLSTFKLNRTSSKKPSFFELVYWNQEEKKEFRYSFSVSSQRIESERLEITEKIENNYSTRLIFERMKSEYKFGTPYKKKLEPITSNVLPGAHAVNVFAQFAIQPCVDFITMITISKVLDGTQDVANFTLDRLYADKNLLNRVQEIMHDSDISLENISIEKSEMNPEQIATLPFPVTSPDGSLPKSLTNWMVITKHQIRDSDEQVSFNLILDESTGTRMLFGYAAILLMALEVGGTAIIDEFATSMHPLIISGLLNLFRSKETNPLGAQLIFVTHDTHVLGDDVKLRRDEIWFVEKNQSEESTLFSLAEYKVRPDLNIEKNYMSGRFGAVPTTKFEE